jgi:hypothetical protein
VGMRCLRTSFLLTVAGVFSGMTQRTVALAGQWVKLKRRHTD